jgi:plasmid maintenance system antidote protein VapI
MSRTVSLNQLGNQLGMWGAQRNIAHAAKPDVLSRNGSVLVRCAGPALVDPDLVACAETYRQAVRLCWALRCVPGMTLRSAAEHCGIHVPHMSDYLAADDLPGRRDMPAGYIVALQQVAGNTAITQWLALQSQLTIAEVKAWRQAA